jgi:hypothetical protein
VDDFVKKHRDSILGTIVCFDRVIFKGHLPLNWPGAMESLMQRNGLLIRDFKDFVGRESDVLKGHAMGMAKALERPYEYLSEATRKDDLAQQIAARDKIKDGLVCVLSTLETCSSFKLALGQTRPRVERARRKCLCLYYYFMDREFGFLHVRIQTWFPFTVQVYINGHEWLARKMDKNGVGYRRLDNAFLQIDDCRRAQRFADRLMKKKWPRILAALARKVNPLLGDLLRGMEYYWVVDQAEYSTDVMFRDRATLKPLYENLLRHATLCFGAEDVMTFLGRKLHGGFAGEILGDCKRRWPGARIKHRMKENWIKMYDKHGCVLRIETVINCPYEFKIRRHGVRQGEEVDGWFPMAKGVANLPRYAEVAGAANRRYLEALAVVSNPGPAQETLRKAARPVRHKGRSYRGFNPALEDDVGLFAAALRGEHMIHGFRNRDLRDHLFPGSTTPEELRRRSTRVSRLLKRLHVHGLVAKIPRSRRWRLTKTGQALMATVIAFHKETYPELFANQAA